MEEYLKNVSQKFSDTQTSEMGYRTDFENLLKSIFTTEQKYKILHDSKSVDGNKPDFIVLKNAVPILYIEAKDIGVSLDKIEKSNQMDRYFGYDNLVLTDYVEFRFYRNGERYEEPVIIANFDKNNRTVTELPQNFSLLSKTLVDFASSHREPIKKGKQLAQIMGGKAQRIRDNVKAMLELGSDNFADLLKIRDVVKESLVSNLDDDSFADMYAQTLVYGLFRALRHVNLCLKLTLFSDLSLIILPDPHFQTDFVLSSTNYVKFLLMLMSKRSSMIFTARKKMIRIPLFISMRTF